MKICSKCKTIKSFAEFNKNSGKSDGLQSTCIQCAKTLRVSARIANPEKVKVCRASYYADNAVKIRAISAKYRAINHDKEVARKRKWSAENLDKRRIYEQNRRSRKYAANGKLSNGLSDLLYKLQRGKCACCGKQLGDDYHLDHIMPLALGGSNEDLNMQLLTAKCNLQKNAKHPIDFMQSRGFLL